MRYSEKWPQYAKWWDKMEIKLTREKEFDKDAKFALANKSIYLQIAARTGHMIWPHIALLHRRESDADFETYLGNGDPLSRRTTHVPKGRGPFKGPDRFLNGALDALHIDGLDAVQDWTLEKILYYCEVFNGGAYSRAGKPSPYIWGGTNIQVVGKVLRDRGPIEPVWDTQPGCAPLLWWIASLDKTVTYVRET